MANSEVLIFFVSDRISTKVNHCVAFCDYMLSDVCKILNCVLYHINYYRGSYVCYGMLSFEICSVNVCCFKSIFGNIQLVRGGTSFLKLYYGCRMLDPTYDKQGHKRGRQNSFAVGENMESKPPSWLKTSSYLPKLMREKHVLMSYLNCVTISGKPCLTNVICYYCCTCYVKVM